MAAHQQFEKLFRKKSQNIVGKTDIVQMIGIALQSKQSTLMDGAKHVNGNTDKVSTDGKLPICCRRDCLPCKSYLLNEVCA